MRKNRGITLIALVITIIILLILAGISISSLIRGITSREKRRSNIRWHNSRLGKRKIKRLWRRTTK